MSPLALALCQPLVCARLANMVGDVIGTLGLREDLGRSIVEGWSTYMSNAETFNVDHYRRTSKHVEHRSSIAKSRNVRRRRL
jgi:hypothetical protein